MLFIRKYRKRILFAAAAVVFFPALAFLLLWWDSRPKDSGKVSIGYLKTVSQGTSNVVTFIVTNQSDFPIVFGIWLQTPDISRGDGWVTQLPSGVMRPVPIGRTPANGTSSFTLPAFPTNRWRPEIYGNDSRVSALDDAREWIARRFADPEGSHRVTGSKSRVHGYGPEMLGDAPAP